MTDPSPWQSTSEPLQVRPGKYSWANSTIAAYTTHSGTSAAPAAASPARFGFPTRNSPSSPNPSGTPSITLAMPSDFESTFAQPAIATRYVAVASSSGRGR
jgi:hypothetical protein